MVRAFHILLATYGFWLPNDPRGSWSQWVRRWEILRYGKATKVATRRSVVARPHDSRQRQAAKNALSFPPVLFNGRQARSVGIGFERAIEESGYLIHACEILPRHAHLVVSRHQRRAEQIVGHLKGRATQQLAADGIHPLAEYRKVNGTVPSPWAQRLWKVFLFHDEDIMRAVGYVERNPLKEGKPEQSWPFVVSFQGSAGQAPPLSKGITSRR